MILESSEGEMVGTSTGSHAGAGLRFEVVNGWGELPEGYHFKEASSVAVDAADNVHVFCRGELPVIVFDRHGRFLRAWGQGVFKHPHAITIAGDGSIWLVDDGAHCLYKYSPDGKLLLTLGLPGVSAAAQSGHPFNQPTHVAIDATGDLIVTDGYSNSRVHRFDAAGKLRFSWGTPGTGPGCFNIPHCVVVDAGGTVFVADRENHRIQRFDARGQYLGQWTNLHRPNCLTRDSSREGYFFVAESGTGLTINARVPNIGNCVSILTPQGDIVGRIGETLGGEAPGQFLAAHGLAVDSCGDLYVAEVTFSVRGRHETPPRELRSLQKFRRVAG
jgi:DNA-binding beta-propeller fold protein YncE